MLHIIILNINLTASFLLKKQTNNRTHQNIQQNMMKCIKVQNRKGTKQIN